MNVFSIFFLSVLLVISNQIAFCQGGIGIGTDAPHQSAVLHIQPPGNDKGLLIPRLSKGQVDALNSKAAEGLLVYDDTNNQLVIFINGQWLSLNALISEGLTGSNAYIQTSGVVGIGSSPNPTGAKLQVAGSLSTNGALTVSGNISATGSTNLQGGLTVGSNSTFSGTVTATSFSGDGIVPKGAIVMWSGTTPPAGWALCNGQSGTPDLRGRFIVGYHPFNSDYNSIGKTGGLHEVTLTIAQIPEHDHGVAAVNTGTFDGFGHIPAVKAGSVESTVDTSKEGQGKPHENRPPYYTLAYIIKL